MRVIQYVVFSWLFVFSLEVRGQIPTIPSSMISQIANMSSNERRQLASQYGINIDDLGVIGVIVSAFSI